VVRVNKTGFIRFLVLLIPPIIAVSGTAAPLRLSEPVVSTPSHETFGAPVDDSLAVHALADVMTQPDAYAEQVIAVRSRVGRVCQKKGCFFVAQAGPHAVRVSFKDYGFFVPTDIGGRTVVLVGSLIKRQVSKDEAEHFSEDLGGAGGEVRSGDVYEIVATSVRVPRL